MTLHRCLAIFAAAIVAACTVGSDEANHLPPPAAEEGWTSLFDGQTLAGWRVAAKPEDRDKGFWKVQDGAITADSRGRPDHDYCWLISERELGDFELRVRVRGYRDSPGNSGIQVRSRYDEAAGWLDGPQIDVHPPAPWRTGLIYDETRETRRWIHPSLPDWRIGEAHAPAGWNWKYAGDGDGWNDIHITCRGTHIRTVVNGNIATDADFAGILDDAAHQSHQVGLRGHIALQLHSKDELYIQYKDIFIRERE
jgi:hypothetical protein